ncbi:portal protein, partial [bacterium]|nr:portal protein [bacterium]
KIREVKRKRDKKNNQVTTQETVQEYFIYNEKGFQNKAGEVGTATAVQGVKIALDSIVHVTSGLLDPNNTVVLSHLHKAIKPLNQLRSLEDAAVVYRISRAPERRIFYIDVGNLPKMKAEQYLRDMMTRFKNKIVYDATTGEVRDDRKFMTMLEDFWFPRREGNRGTEITTLPAGQQLGEMGDIEYFQKKLYESLNVPVSRLQSDGTFNFGGQDAEVSRDEMKFSKFVDRVRSRFNSLFLQALEKQLVLKNIMTEEDWKTIKNVINFRYAKDNYYDQQKNASVIRDRLSTLAQIQPFIGTYYSNTWVRKNILHQTDEDIEQMDEESMSEQNNPLYQQGQMQQDGDVGGGQAPAQNAPQGPSGSSQVAPGEQPN